MTHLDVCQNHLASIPVCVLRMDRLQSLNVSDNRLTDLPEDMDRLQQLVSLYLHNNSVAYIPHCLTNIITLKMVVVNGEDLTCVPIKLCYNPSIKFIRLHDKHGSGHAKSQKTDTKKGSQEEQRTDEGEKEFLEAYVRSLEDRESVPYSTTKISISCQL